ncbi:NAD(P)/FAD-dependent oxidoreductase [Caballeronia humi]|uniref:FAD-dependent oxidoreductase n=1 Tax=Caballeronia humi TaxID=326474 RepID=A0A158JCC1_9BURK|nr:FAD-dependent oxidoreductase [Caballeronia humi]SAL66183.1 FAD-dependent oxidoreductase [Caballeronia humi]
MNNRLSRSSSTLWASTALPRAASEAVGGPLQVDVAIVGGGFTGLSAALHLAQAGVHAALFEAFEIGHRASGRNGGQVVPGVKPPPSALIKRFGDDAARRMMRFSYGSADELFALVDRYQIHCHPTRNGWLQGAYSQASSEYLRQRSHEINRHGGNTVHLDRDEMRAATGSDYWPSGLLEKSAGAVQPLAYARGLARAVTDLGGTLHEYSPVQSISSSSGKFELQVNGHAVQARKVILATDAYTDRLLPEVAQSYVNVSSAQIATDPLPPELQQRLMPLRAGISETRKITYYCRLDPKGRFVIGGRGRNSDKLDPATREQLRQAARQRFPELNDVAFTHGWACRVGMTIDDLPHLHELAEGLWTAYGYCGRGVAMGTVLGRVLGEAVRGMPAAALDYPVTPVTRLPLYPVRQISAMAALQWYRLRDAMGYPG